MYFGDHAPPRFHIVTNSNERVSVTIENLDVRAGSAHRRDIAEALAWASQYKRELLAVWEKLSEESK